MTPEDLEVRAGCMFTKTPDDKIIQALSVVRAGRTLTPDAWPNGCRVAVSITFDVDHEFPVYKLDPALLSLGEYGATTALPRVLSTLKKFKVPSTFFVPAMVQKLHPETIPSILAAGPHEIGLHGWVHERAPELNGKEEETEFLRKSIEVLAEAAGGRQPVGYRAPNAAISEFTLEILQEYGIAYDSTLSARDEPHELLLRGEKLDVVEIPMAWENTDYIFLHNDEFWQGSLPWPRAVLENYITDFEMAYEEGTIFNLVLHPQVIGRRSKIHILETLLRHIASKEGVWFATLEQISNVLKR